MGIQASPPQHGCISCPTWSRLTFSSSAGKHLRAGSPSWSKSEPLKTPPVCEACQILLAYQADLMGGSLTWGTSWHQPGKCAEGGLKLNGNALAWLSPVRGIWGKSFLGFEKSNRETSGFDQLRGRAVSPVPSPCTEQQSVTPGTAKMSFSGSHKLC